jgi:hypothetical protein
MRFKSIDYFFFLSYWATLTQFGKHLVQSIYQAWRAEGGSWVHYLDIPTSENWCFSSDLSTLELKSAPSSIVGSCIGELCFLSL